MSGIASLQPAQVTAIANAFPMTPRLRAELTSMRHVLHHPDSSVAPLFSSPEIARIDASLGDMLGETTSVGEGMIALIDTYRDSCLAHPHWQLFAGFTTSTVSLPSRPQPVRPGFSEAFLWSQFYPSTAQLVRETPVWEHRKLIPFLGSDTRRVVHEALGIEHCEVADGTLIVSYLCFVQHEMNWTPVFCCEDSTQAAYFAMFAARQRPCLVGPHRHTIHGVNVEPLFALYHDLQHLAQVGVQYGAAFNHRLGVARYHRVMGALAELGLADLAGRAAPGFYFTLGSLLCEGARLDDQRIPWPKDRPEVRERVQALET